MNLLKRTDIIVCITSIDNQAERFEMKSRRNSSFELLRIFSMFAIVLHHYAYHGTFKWQQYSVTYLPTLRINIVILLLGKLGVDLFVLLGAYFLSQKDFNIKRPIKLLIITLFYSFFIFIFLKPFFPQFAKESLGQLLLPLPFPSGYWFVGAYIFMLLCMPLINLMLRVFSKKKITLSIVLLVVLWSILPTLGFLFPGKPDFSYDVFGSSAGTYFLLLYLISGYMRKYGLHFLNSKIKLWGTLLLTLIVIALWTYMCTLNSHSYEHGNIFVLLYNPIDLLLAVIIFTFFTRFTFYSKVVNEISLSMFGVYLISENSFVRPILWQNIANSGRFAGTWEGYLLNALWISFCVFISCIIIDFLIRKIFGRFFNKVTLWMSEKIGYFID